MTRVALYARVSTEEQTDGYSLEAQLTAMRDHAARQGWQVLAEFVDAGYSARTDNRPQFKAMIGEAKERKFDIILVHKFDRFARSREHSVTYKALLRKLNISVQSVTEPTDPDSPSSIILEGMLEVMAEWYSANLSQETQKGKRQRAQSGLYNGTLCYGYQKGEDGIPTPHPFEAEGVRKAFEAYATGNYSDKDIADLLNSLGHRTRSNWGVRPWSKDSVTALLRNPFYLGHTKYHGKLLPGKHQPIISEELFARAQEVRKRRTRAPRSNCKHFRTYILSGILRCVTCGGRLTAQSVRGNRYYRDRAGLRSQPCTQPQTGIRADEVEAQLDSIVAQFRLLPTWRERVLDLISSRPERQRLQRERERLEEKLRRLAKQYREVEIDEEEYRRERDATRRKLSSLVVPAETEVLAAGAYLEDMVQVWSTATLEEKRSMALLIFDAVYYDVAAKRIAALKPKAAFIPVFRQSPCLVETSDGMFSIGGSDGIRTRDLLLDRQVC